ncbi:hypothetical protein COLO4_33740 [Corchorus olitorius]|uniref:Uncharacterized protein n=1 Tax=Corchorus olitorius TaxID=93759 RepID=A0A1R3GRY2_9ROSI|nr:hypothetical protein COLO4_33740 [Corchorus olitorius]
MEEFEREREREQGWEIVLFERESKKTESCCVKKGAIEGVLECFCGYGGEPRDGERREQCVYREMRREREFRWAVWGENGRVDSCLESEREDESKVVEKGTVKSIWKGSGWR